MDYSEQKQPVPKVNEPDLSGTYTARDYISWQVDELMELIRGKIFKMSPSPRVNHQRVSSQLYLLICRKWQSKGSCEVFQAPLDVYLVHPGEDWKKTGNVVEPDLFIVCDPSKIHERGCVGAPDLVVEVLSPSTSKKDASLKLDLYEEYGIREYWMISVENKMVIANILNEKGKYETQRPAVNGELIAPRDFPNLKVDLEELFSVLPEEQ